jgi:predicted hotdog family 3-hydroxylacyl-ACP dehydratase
MWETEPTTAWEKDVKYYAKKRPRELAAILNNIGRYVKLIAASKNSRAVQAGFLHPEPMEIMAVDQKGGGPNLEETRAYTYADDEKEVLYLITLRNKSSQSSDIELAKEFVAPLKPKTTKN